MDSGIGWLCWSSGIGIWAMIKLLWLAFMIMVTDKLMVSFIGWGGKLKAGLIIRFSRHLSGRAQL